MTRSESIRALAALLAASLLPAHPPSRLHAAQPQTDPRPNVIIVLCDDMGFSDLGCFGGEIDTPNLDRLAGGGLRFTQFYNTARCCPTRASVLTGLYPHQAGIGHMMEDHQLPGYRGDLNPRTPTIAQALRPAGYRTYAVGKWHVTPNPKEFDRHNWPLQRGFDRFYGTIHGAGSFYDPNSLTRDNAFVAPGADPEYRPANGYYYTDAISDHAARFIREHARDHRQHPFFLYVAYTAAHWPMHARDEDIFKYKGRYDAGYTAIRQARIAKAKRLGVVIPSQELSPQDEDWAQVENREFETRCMEVYAAMIDRMDQGIGRIIGALEDAGTLDNTLVLYLQDNGGCAEAMGRRGPFVPRPERPTLPPMPPGTLQDQMIPKQTRDGYPVRQGYGVMPGPADTYIGYGRGWANVSNTPFREYKHWVHEGGISTPLIAHWPAGITARGALRSQPAHLVDLMATCLDVAKAVYPRLSPADPNPEGRSLLPAFADRPIDRDAIFWEHEGNRAIRVGDWKLVAKGPVAPWELYQIPADRAELHDLATRHPERVADMAARWEAWARRAHVIPWIWGPPHGDAKPAGKGGKRKARKADH